MSLPTEPGSGKLNCFAVKPLRFRVGVNAWCLASVCARFPLQNTSPVTYTFGVTDPCYYFVFPLQVVFSWFMLVMLEFFSTYVSLSFAICPRWIISLSNQLLLGLNTVKAPNAVPGACSNISYQLHAFLLNRDTEPNTILNPGRHSVFHKGKMHKRLYCVALNLGHIVLYLIAKNPTFLSVWPSSPLCMGQRAFY
jgi:hypothetical protein